MPCRTHKRIRLDEHWPNHQTDEAADCVAVVQLGRINNPGMASSDCGLLAIANATAICSGVDPTSQDRDQPEMKNYFTYFYSTSQVQFKNIFLNASHN